MAGPGKKPPQLKVVAGTARKDRASETVVELPTIEKAPEPPTWLLNAHAVNEWHRLAKILTANKLLTEGGLSVLGVLCSVHGEIVRQTSVGMMPPAHLVAQYRQLANDFGLTPVAQGKVRAGGEEKKPAGRFAGVGKRPA
jgi:phage terminase small subunit